MKKPRRLKDPSLGPLAQVLPVQQVEVFQELLDQAGIPSWDLLLFGDGSGSTWDRAAGWSSLLLERCTRQASLWYGCSNRGTVNFAEIMAYLAPLQWLLARQADRCQADGAVHQVLKVHVFTDSQYVEQSGKKRQQGAGLLPSKNGLLWAGFDAMARHGLKVLWHWLSRDPEQGGSLLNVIAHHGATLSRKLIQSCHVVDGVEKALGATIQELTHYRPQGHQHE